MPTEQVRTYTPSWVSHSTPLCASQRTSADDSKTRQMKSEWQPQTRNALPSIVAKCLLRWDTVLTFGCSLLWRLSNQWEGSCADSPSWLDCFSNGTLEEPIWLVLQKRHRPTAFFPRQSNLPKMLLVDLAAIVSFVLTSKLHSFSSFEATLQTLHAFSMGPHLEPSSETLARWTETRGSPTFIRPLLRKCLSPLLKTFDL